MAAGARHAEAQVAEARCETLAAETKAAKAQAERFAAETRRARADQALVARNPTATTRDFDEKERERRDAARTFFRRASGRDRRHVVVAERGRSRVSTCRTYGYDMMVINEHVKDRVE